MARWFGWRALPVAAAAAGVLLLVHYGARGIDRLYPDHDIPRWWPVSVVFERFAPARTLGIRVLRGAGVLLAYEVVARWAFARERRALWRVTVGGAVLVLASTAIQGLPSALSDPVAGWLHDGIQYYHDAVVLDSAGELLQRYTAWQPHLLAHSATHPPGPALTYFWLHGLFRSPVVTGLVLTYASIALASAAVWRLAEFDGSTTREAGAAVAVWSLLCLPATQIYGCSCFDFVLASFVVATVAVVVVVGRSAVAVAVGGLLLFAVSMGTFVWPFALVLAGLGEHARRHRVTRTLGVLGVTIVAHALLAMATGFDYVESFLIASRLENPGGFYLAAQPLDYVMTRLEGVAELALFAGPFALIAMAAGARRPDADAKMSWRLGVAAPALLGLMLLAGAFRTGETARAAGFVYPFLSLLVARATIVGDEPIDPVRLGRPIFAQGVIMQVWGWYFW